jgi:hypothetical protein
LGNRVQHALRAYTPKDQKAVRAAAETFRPNPAFKTEEAIGTLETGEALVSFLDEKGAPAVVQRARILFPLSQIGAITAQQRYDINRTSRLAGKYDMMIDRESAFEVLLRESATQQVMEQYVKGMAGVPNKAQGSDDDEKEEKPSKKKGLFSKVMKAVMTAATSTTATSIGTVVSDMVTGKQTKSRTSTSQKLVKNSTSAATRTIMRDILGNLIK